MTLLVTYAVALIIEGVLYKIYGANYVQIERRYTNRACTCSASTSSYIYIYGFMLAVAAGRGHLRAALPDQVRPQRPGHHAGRDRRPARRHQREPGRALTFGIGVAVTAAGGMVYGATNAFNANSGYDLISRLLAIIILGGMGSVGGGARRGRLHDHPGVAWWTSGHPPGRSPSSTPRSCWSWCSARRASSAEGGAGPVSPPPRGRRPPPGPPARRARQGAGLLLLLSHRCFPQVFSNPSSPLRRVRDDLRHGRGARGTSSLATPATSRSGRRCSSAAAPTRWAMRARTGISPATTSSRCCRYRAVAASSRCRSG